VQVRLGLAGAKCAKTTDVPVTSIAQSSVNYNKVY